MLIIPQLRARCTCTLASSWFRTATPLSPSSAAVAPSRPSHALRQASTRPSRPLQKDGRMIDEDIPHRTITLVDPETSSLLPPASLQSILASLDRTRFSILLVDASKDVPICKILDKKAEWDKKQAKKTSANASSAASPTGKPKASAPGPPKEVHLTWGVTPHDLSHKLAKARELLGKGSRVTVVLKDKQGAERPSNETKNRVVADVERSMTGSGKCVKKGQRAGIWSLEFVAQDA